MELSRESVYSGWRQRLAWTAHFLKARFRRYQVEAVEQVIRYIPAGGVIFDVGAHFGYFAKEFCRIHAASCQVYCFEPVSYTHSILTRVVGKCPNVKIENFALSDRSGTVSISIPIKASGRLGIGLSHFGAEQARDFITENIATVRLDDYLQQHHLSRLDFIKCDVEGAELLVFRGAAAALDKYRPAVLCEVNEDYASRIGYKARDIFDFFALKNYRAHRPDEFENFVAVEAYQGSSDYLFLPVEKIGSY